jgi:hypothetical protein
MVDRVYKVQEILSVESIAAFIDLKIVKALVEKYRKLDLTDEQKKLIKMFDDGISRMEGESNFRKY